MPKKKVVRKAAKKKSVRRAAIGKDALGAKTLDQLSAADFLTALNEHGVSASKLTIWPEKKKIELWVEPERIGKIPVIDFIDIIRGEKKKYELEKNPGWERWNPVDVLSDPQIDVIADRVAARLQGRS